MEKIGYLCILIFSITLLGCDDNENIKVNFEVVETTSNSVLIKGRLDGNINPSLVDNAGIILNESVHSFYPIKLESNNTFSVNIEGLMISSQYSSQVYLAYNGIEFRSEKNHLKQSGRMMVVR